MEENIQKSSSGSKVVPILKWLLFIQIILIVLCLVRNHNMNVDRYCSEHGYQHEIHDVINDWHGRGDD